MKTNVSRKIVKTKTKNEEMKNKEEIQEGNLNWRHRKDKNWNFPEFVISMCFCIFSTSLLYSARDKIKTKMKKIVDENCFYFLFLHILVLTPILKKIGNETLDFRVLDFFSLKFYQKCG